MSNFTQKYQSVPHEVTAIQYIGRFSTEIKEFLGGWPYEWIGSRGIKIGTIDGVQWIENSDWLVRGSLRFRETDSLSKMSNTVFTSKYVTMEGEVPQ